ncbi:hypothetical protein BDA96_01G228700 [Sorghum bicolor]|uniref:Uncharacterized protein n=2 Tax=Sorghum bicolor TaxID=4558 RepID=A0A921UZG6_SORBI|nr:hypothetical protein BDA96_01G228700 [Sorghum bicolor]KXG38296.1 hypothetical protein SORBI_3001G214400 [Sorghum bicolor]
MGKQSTFPAMAQAPVGAYIVNANHKNRSILFPTPLFQIIRCFGFSRYIAFAMHLDMEEDIPRPVFLLAGTLPPPPPPSRIHHRRTGLDTHHSTVGSRQSSVPPAVHMTMVATTPTWPSHLLLRHLAAVSPIPTTWPAFLIPAEMEKKRGADSRTARASRDQSCN